MIILLFTSARPLENQIDVISCRRRSFERYVANVFTCEGSVAPGPITGSSPITYIGLLPASPITCIGLLPVIGPLGSGVIAFLSTEICYYI